jgi:DNA mismatch repair protein MutS2
VRVDLRAINVRGGAPSPSDIILSHAARRERRMSEITAIANEKALKDLEFERMRSLVLAHASSPLGEEALRALRPSADRAEIEAAVDEVNEAIGFLERRGRFSLGAIRDLALLLRRARDSAFLDGEEFLEVLHTIDGTREIRAQLAGEEGTPRLRAHADRLTGGGDALRRQIVRVLDERGDVRDDASANLKDLVRRSRTLESRLETKLRAVIDRHPELISEGVITRRRGRLVIPIRSGATGAMDFVVHDRSSSGQTLYAEPTALVAENNQLAELSGEVRDEIRRILRELTEAFVAAEPALLRDRAVLAHLDSLFARASYAGAHRCAFPTLGRRILLRDARHPLLSAESVVPITFSLGDRHRMTVITGPNTGGKTVTLKTVGLLALMVQSAIPIPASPDSELPILFRVRTDIGDEQSIEQSLSTFSAHMVNLISILREASAGDLVLLDELGAGTDPEEGAALGLAMLEDLLESGALVAASTHLTPLKFFAVRHPEIQTASMEFDLETLSPTFRVIEGLPGKSNAFAIAERLGLGGELVRRARDFRTHGEIRAEDIIEELHRERSALARLREDADRERGEMRRFREEYERKLGRLEEQKETELSTRLRALEASLRDGQRRLEEILARANADARADVTRRGLQDVSALREELRERRGDLERGGEDARIDPGSVEAGQLVCVSSLAADGRVVHFDEGGKVIVDLDGIRVTTELDDLAPPRGRDDSETPRERRRARVRRPRPESVPLQLNVRGKTVAEALRELEDYLDQLLLADIRSASVLHGKGTGTLRNAVHAYLGSCSFVATYGFAPPNQGGEGVTVFELAGDEGRD